MNLSLEKRESQTAFNEESCLIIKKRNLIKKMFSRKYIAICCFLILFSSIFAQSISVPSYSVQRTKSGYVYTFFVRANYIVRYRVFDSFTGRISVGSAMNGETLAISHNDTVVAWTETYGGTKSHEIMLGKNVVQDVNSHKFEVISPVNGTWANKIGRASCRE